LYLAPAGALGSAGAGLSWSPISRDLATMRAKPSEQLGGRHRMTRTADFAAVRAGGAAYRGAHCLVVVVSIPGEPTRVGFVASRRGVGGAVQRNRARRRIREIVRRRWSRVAQGGYLLMFVAFRSAVTVSHQELASDVEKVLAATGALAPIPGV
jgi:ribonuclease P protein component